MRVTFTSCKTWGHGSGNKKTKAQAACFTESFGWHQPPPCEGTQTTETGGTTVLLGEQPNPTACPHSTSTETKRLSCLAPEQTRKAPSPSTLLITPVLRGLGYRHERTKQVVSHWESSDNYLQTIIAPARGSAVVMPLPWMAARRRSQPGKPPMASVCCGQVISKFKHRKKENPVSITFKFHF